MISGTDCREVRRNVPMAGGTVAAIFAIRSSLITPGPLGIVETKPRADAPHSIASAASSTLAMQQTFNRGLRVGFIAIAWVPHFRLCVADTLVRCLWFRPGGFGDESKNQRQKQRTGVSATHEKDLLPVGNPDIFHLRRVLQEPSALGYFRVEPIDGATFVCPNLLQVSNRHCLGCIGAYLVAKAP
jgi:hypothetical protein